MSRPKRVVPEQFQAINLSLCALQQDLDLVAAVLQSVAIEVRRHGNFRAEDDAGAREGAGNGEAVPTPGPPGPVVADPQRHQRYPQLGGQVDGTRGQPPPRAADPSGVITRCMAGWRPATGAAPPCRHGRSSPARKRSPSGPPRARGSPRPGGGSTASPRCSAPACRADRGYIRARRRRDNAAATAAGRGRPRTRSAPRGSRASPSSRARPPWSTGRRTGEKSAFQFHGIRAAKELQNNKLLDRSLWCRRPACILRQAGRLHHKELHRLFFCGFVPLAGKYFDGRAGHEHVAVKANT